MFFRAALAVVLLSAADARKQAAAANPQSTVLHFGATNEGVDATAEMASFMGSGAAKTQLVETVCNQAAPEPEHDAVIVVLVPPTPLTWRSGSTMKTLQSTKNIMDNNRAEVRLFHDEADKLSPADMQKMFAAAGPRKVCATKIRFAQFPSGFTLHRQHPEGLFNFGWNYMHMIRFNFVDLFDPTIGMLAGYKYWMRMDSDTEWAGQIPDEFKQFDNDVNLGYLHNREISDGGPVAEGLDEFTKQFATSHGIDLASVPAVSDTIGPGVIRGYYNNLELGRIAMFQTPLALEYTKAIVGNQGIYKHRWGDALLRRIVVELTHMKTEQVKHSTMINFRHAGQMPLDYR